MSIRSNAIKQQLLLSSGKAAAAAMAVAVAGPALAQVLADPAPATVTTNSAASIGVEQNYNAIAAADGISLNGNSIGSISITATDDDATTNSVVSSTLTVGTSSATRNVATTGGYANDANLTVATSFNNVTGSGVANTAATYTKAAGPDSAATADADSDVAIALVQTNTLASATVQQTVDMGINADGITNSSLQVSSNAQQGIGVLNNGTTSLASAGNASSGSAGIAVGQSSFDSDLEVSTNSIDNIVVGAGDGVAAVASSTVLLTGNSQSAVAVGNQGANSQTVTGNGITLAAAGQNSGAISGVLSQAVAGYATTSAQGLIGGPDRNVVSATTDGGNDEAAGYSIAIDSTVSGSAVRNDSNLASAAVRGNDVVNTITGSAINSLTTQLDGETAPGSVMAVSNTQEVLGYALTATTFGANGGIANSVAGNVQNASTLSASSNTASADAIGNRATNGIAVTATSIDTSGLYESSAVASPAGAGADAAFSIANSQAVGNTVTITSSLVDNVANPASSASVRTAVGGSVLGSAVLSNSNVLSASATGNLVTSGSNSISLSGTNLATTAALANAQGSDANISAVIGAKGGSGTTIPASGIAPGTVLKYPVKFDGSVSNNTKTINLNSTFTVSGVGLSQADKDLLTGSDFALVNGDYVYTLTDSMDIGSLPSFLQSAADDNWGSFASGNAEFSLDYTLVDGFNYVPASTLPGGSASGVTIAIADAVLDSSVSVLGNTIDGSVTGNNAANRVVASATNLTSGSGEPGAVAGLDGIPVAAADYALTNFQGVGIDASVDLTTDVAGTFAIETGGNGVTGGEVTNSTLSVSGNAMAGTTTGNTASNGVNLTGTNITSSAALENMQLGSADASAATDMVVYAPAANVGSTLKLDNNTNTATATLNTASNTMRVAADNTLTTTTGSVDADLADGNVLSRSDYIVSSLQNATGSTTALANTVVVNQDSGTVGQNAAASPTNGINASLVEANGNVTAATASANRASNTLALSANAGSATGGVLNQQFSGSGVQADVSTAVAVLVDTAQGYSPLDTGSVTIANNASTARAGGNTAANTLNAAATSFTVPASAAAATDVALSAGPSEVIDQARESFAILNSQVNTGPVGASVSVTYGAGFVSGAVADAAVDNSSVVLNGNTTSAVAYGNAANNGLTLTALNLGSTQAAIASQQVNVNNVSAQAQFNPQAQTGGAYAIATNGGGVNASQLSISRSTMSAVATGNSNTSVLTVTGNSAAF